MMRRLLNLVGGLLLVCAATISFFHQQSLEVIVFFVERYLSPDNQLEPQTIKLIAAYFFLLKIFLVVSGVVLATPLGYILWLSFQKVCEASIDMSRLKSFLFANSRLQETTEKRFFIASAAAALLMHVLVLLSGEPAHEGLLETTSTFGFLLAGFLAFYALFHARKQSDIDILPKYTRLFLGCLSFVLLVLFGEELSWGQRVFGWESFGIFEKYNFQKETTIHNFFNPLFTFIYPAFGVSFFISSVLFWVFPAKKVHALLFLIAPPPSFSVLIFVMAGFSFKGHSEAFEVLLALFFVLYTYRIVLILRKVRPLIGLPARAHNPKHETL